MLPLTAKRVPLPTPNSTPFLRHTTELTVPATSNGRLTVPPNCPTTSFTGATSNRGAPAVVNRTPAPVTAAPGPARFISRTWYNPSCLPPASSAGSSSTAAVAPTRSTPSRNHCSCTGSVPVYCALKRYTLPTTPANSRATPAVATGRLTGVAVPDSTVATTMSGLPAAAGSTTVSVTSALVTLPAAFDANTR